MTYSRIFIFSVYFSAMCLCRHNTARNRNQVLDAIKINTSCYIKRKLIVCKIINYYFSLIFLQHYRKKVSLSCDFELRPDSKFFFWKCTMCERVTINGLISFYIKPL